MWKTKSFKSEELQQKWIEKNKKKYRIEIIYVNNGFAVEFRELKKINL